MFAAFATAMAAGCPALIWTPKVTSAPGEGATQWVLRRAFGLDDGEGRYDAMLLVAIGAKQP